ncbi:MAG: hypothetical protein AAF798_16625 [Bacteroidota bacterium]
MLFRLLIVFGCVVVFINGCNSLISQEVGTHKLRTYQMAEIAEEGIGDADFVEIQQAWQTGEYVHVEAVRQFDRPILIYPVQTQEQINSGEKVAKLIAWTELFDVNCLDDQSCLPQQEVTLKGITRDIPAEKNQLQQLLDKGYTLDEQPIFIEVDKAPLEWYWNLGMMLGALALGAGIEIVHLRKTRKKQLEV